MVILQPAEVGPSQQYHWPVCLFSAVHGRVRVGPPPTCIQPSEAQALELVFVEIESWICAIAGQPCSPTQSEHGFLTGFQLFPPFIT